MRAEPIGRLSSRQPCFMTKNGSCNPQPDLGKNACSRPDIPPSRSGRPADTAFRVSAVGSTAGRAHLRKPLADPQQQAVADLTIGVQFLLTAAIDAGGIRGRPVF